MRPILKITSYWKYTTSGIRKSFHALKIVFNVKIVRKQLLNKLQQNTRRSGNR
jgi:hypothetical protein